MTKKEAAARLQRIREKREERLAAKALNDQQRSDVELRMAVQRARHGALAHHAEAMYDLLDKMARARRGAEAPYALELWALMRKIDASLAEVRT